MSSLETHEVAINLALFKIFHLYNVFDPNLKKYAFNKNAYQLGIYGFSAIVLCINLYGLWGFMSSIEYDVGDLNFFQTLITHLSCFIFSLQIITYTYHADTIWDILCHITRVNFLTSKQCTKYIDILYGYREISRKITNFIFVTLTTTIFVWLIFPLFSFIARLGDDAAGRYENIFNLRFPVSIRAYNDFYLVFYIFEGIALFFLGYIMLIVDVLIISISYGIIAQYEVLALAFENVGHEEEHTNSKYKNIKKK